MQMNENNKTDPYWIVLAIIWMVFIVWLLTQPGSVFVDFPFPRFRGLDKLIHCFLFFVLGFLWMQGLGNTVWMGLLIIIVLLCFGSLTEFIQLWIPGRHGNILDSLANTLGTISGVSVAWLWRHVLLPQLKPKC